MSEDEKMKEIIKNEHACFVNSWTPPISTKHICWHTTRTYDTDKKSYVYNLYELAEETLPHPDAPEDAVVHKIDLHFVKSFLEQEADFLVLLKSAQDNCINRVRNLKIDEPK